jgi:hypothetical protein
MLKLISNAIGSELPIVNMAFYTTAVAFAGRKFCLAAGYRVGGVVIGLLGSQNTSEWTKASNDYLTLAKKDAVRDLTAVAGFIGAVILAGSVIEEANEEKPKEPGFLENYRGTIGFIGGFIAKDPALWMLKKMWYTPPKPNDPLDDRMNFVQALIIKNDRDLKNIK